jgi:hypothetical protein
MLFSKATVTVSTWGCFWHIFQLCTQVWPSNQPWLCSTMLSSQTQPQNKAFEDISFWNGFFKTFVREKIKSPLQPNIKLIEYHPYDSNGTRVMRQINSSQSLQTNPIVLKSLLFVEAGYISILSGFFSEMEKPQPAASPIITDSFVGIQRKWWWTGSNKP